MFDSDADIISEGACSAGYFGCSVGIYKYLVPSMNPFDILLLLFGSILPTNIGCRVGALAAMLLSDTPIVKNVAGATFYSYMPHHLKEFLFFVFSNSKLCFGIFGGFIGAIVFLFLFRDSGLHRYAANVLSAAATGFSIAIVLGILLLIFNFFRMFKHPQAFFSTITLTVMNAILGIIGGVIIGLIFGLTDLISKKNRLNIYY